MSEIKSFNLWDEEWICVLDRDCQIKTVSLFELFRDANHYKSLAGETETQNAAMLRFLLAILHTVFSRMDEQGNENQITVRNARARWKTLWDMGYFPMRPIEKYFEKWKNRFDMFDPEFIVINLILSDGDKNKFGRNVIFNPNIKYFGIASTILPPNKVLVVIDFCEDFEFDGDNIPINIQNKYKEKQNSYISNELPSKKFTNIEKNDKDIKLRDPRKRLNEKKKRDIFYYDLDNLDEEEFFEKEFDTNYGKYEKEKNSYKKMFSTVATDEKGKQRTIYTTIIETVDKNGLKKGYYIEKVQKGSKYIDSRPQEQIEKEKRDMEFPLFFFYFFHI